MNSDVLDAEYVEAVRLEIQHLTNLADAYVQTL
jgi:hypothetical protein